MKDILVIDDDPAVGLALRRVLERQGHRVVVCESTEQGLTALRRRHFDVALVDMVMPQSDGVAAVRAIAQEWPQLRIVAISGGGTFSDEGFRPGALGTAAYLAAAQGAGAHATLTKPFQARELLLAVGCRVLVVDDEPTIRLALRRVLERAGYVVESAGSGTEALDVLRARGVDILITDLLMPRLNGVELIRTAARERPALRIVAISGGGSAAMSLSTAGSLSASPLLSAAREAGAHAVLTKPFEVQDILAAVGHPQPEP